MISQNTLSRYYPGSGILHWRVAVIHFILVHIEHLHYFIYFSCANSPQGYRFFIYICVSGGGNLRRFTSTQSPIGSDWKLRLQKSRPQSHGRDVAHRGEEKRCNRQLACETIRTKVAVRRPFGFCASCTPSYLEVGVCEERREE